MEHEVAISHLRDVLGIAYQHVSRTNEPVIVKRYNRSDVALVPLWEWRWLKQIEAGIRAGEIDVSDFLRDLEESGRI
jgi:hypothetical protein